MAKAKGCTAGARSCSKQVYCHAMRYNLPSLVKPQKPQQLPMPGFHPEHVEHLCYVACECHTLTTKTQQYSTQGMNVHLVMCHAGHACHPRAVHMPQSFDYNGYNIITGSEVGPDEYAWCCSMLRAGHKRSCVTPQGPK